MMMRRFRRACWLLTVLFVGPCLWAGEIHVNAEVPWHPVVLDSQGKLLAWYQPERNMGYDHVVRLAWDFIEHKVPVDSTHGTNLKVYLTNAVYDPQTLQGAYWQHDPAMVYASFVDSLVTWYAYSGDREAVAAVRSMLDYQLAHGTTPNDWDWPGVPFATSCGNDKEYGRCVEDMPQEFYGGIETDKIGELGAGYMYFYELTGERKYLDAALHCANALARHVRPGDADHTPWAFRVDARTGVTLAQEEYGGNLVGALRLFDELIRLNQGDVKTYRAARETTLKWLLGFPMNGGGPAWNKWTGYFEDIPSHTDDINQLTPMMAAYYILNRENPAEIDPMWLRHVGRLLDWVRAKLGRGPFFGAQAIDEQTTPNASFGCCSRAGQGDHTARWAAVNALYFEKTGDGQAREDAFRSLNYGTYFARDDGRVLCCGIDYQEPYWFSDGYSDYIRHFMWAMGAVPEFAPAGVDHLLRSSSVVREVTYAAHSVQYRTFDAQSVEVLRLGFTPTEVRAGGQRLNLRDKQSDPGYSVESLTGGDCIVRIRHVNSGEVSIRG
jgi:hypothetical protein